MQILSSRRQTGCSFYSTQDKLLTKISCWQRTNIKFCVDKDNLLVRAEAGVLNAYACQCCLGFELCEYVRLSLSNCKTISRVVKRTGSSERTVLILETLDVCDCLITSFLAKNVQPAAFLVFRVASAHTAAIDA